MSFRNNTTWSTSLSRRFTKIVSFAVLCAFLGACLHSTKADGYKLPFDDNRLRPPQLVPAARIRSVFCPVLCLGSSAPYSIAKRPAPGSLQCSRLYRQQIPMRVAVGCSPHCAVAGESSSTLEEGHSEENKPAPSSIEADLAKLEAHVGTERKAGSTHTRNASISLHAKDDEEDYHTKRRRQKQRHAEYLQRGQRLGSFSPRAAQGNTYIRKDEQIKMNHQLNEAELKVDQMLSGTDVQIKFREMEKCGIEIDATVSGEFTRELWELTLASLRANFRSSLSSSPLDVSAAYLLQRAGGVSAVRQDVIRFLSEAIQRKAQVEHNLRVMGEVKFTEDISELGDRFSPGTPFTLHLRAELHPRVRFKRSYKGLNLRVPRQPYVKGHLFKLTTDYLLYKHSTVTDYPESAHPADEGDSVLLQVEFGWFEERDGSFGPKIPSEFICGETTLDLLRPWIPVELLGAVKGISLGERRTVKLAIPFSTSQLLEINARQAYDASEEQQTDVGERRMTEGCSEEGRSLVPLYLQSLAGTEKDKFLRKFFSQEGESPGDVGGTAASEVASAADTGDASTEERSNIAGKEQVGISGDTYEDSGEEAEDEIHHIDCLLQVKCVGVKRRIWPAADDAFFQKACQMSRAELWEKIEAAAEDLAKNAASKHALGAAAQALDEISQVDVPESLFDAQANATWKQQLRAREIQGENDKKNRTKEDFMKWKEENRRGIESILTTAFAIQAVYKREGLQVDEKKLQADLAKALLQTTGEAPEAVLKQLYKKAQAALVYKFILEHANVEYYVNDTPAEITVQPDGTAVPQQGVRAFPRGVDVEEWHKTRRETVKERDNLRKQAERFYIDPKTVKKLDNDNSTKPE